MPNIPCGVAVFPESEGSSSWVAVAKKVSVSVFVCAFGLSVMFGCCLWGPLFSPVAGGRPGRRCWGKSSSKSSPSVRLSACCMLAEFNSPHSRTNFFCLTLTYFQFEDHTDVLHVLAHFLARISHQTNFNLH